jgi:hypothetical protein
MNAEQKAVAACAKYVRLRMEIKRLSAAIGEAIEYCPGVGGKRRVTQAFGGATFTNIDESDPTHLKEAYEPDLQGYPPEAVYMEPEDILEYLAVCPHCLAAHNAIQARKAARKSLGAAKRAITMIGRKAITA